jgi:PAS domain S-box-containing protein
LVAVLAAIAGYLLGERVHEHGLAWDGLLASVVVLAAARQGLAAWEYQTSVQERLAAQTDYRALFEGMAEGFAHCRVHSEGGQAVDFEYLRVNSRFGPLTGLHDVVGRRVSELVPRFRETNADLLAMYGRVAKGGPAEHAEVEVPGMGRWFRITAYGAGPGEFVAVFDNITEWKAVEGRLRFQARLLESVGQAVVATDAEGRITYWGRGAEALYGWKAAEAVGRPILEVTPTQPSQAQAAAILSDLQAGKAWSGEILVRRKDGSSFTALVRDDPILDGDGRLAGIIGVSQDISAIKDLELDLRERVKEMDALSRVATLGAQTDDLPKLLQETVHAIEGAFLHADAWALVRAGGAAAASEGDPPEGPELRSFTTTDPDAGSVSVRYRTSHHERDIGPFLREEQVLLDAVADLLTTIVGRQRASERVRFQAHLLQSVSQAVTATDIEGRVTYWNPAAAQLFGWTAAEALGRHISELWGEALVPASGDGSSGAQGDHYMTVRDGRRLVVNMASSGLLDVPGGLRGFITITQDVTEARSREERLRLNESRLREAQSVAHLGSWVFDLRDGSSVWSEEMYRIFGQDPEGFVPTYDSMLAAVHPEDRALVAQRFREAAESGAPFLMEHRIDLPDGTSKYVLERARFVRDDQGQVLHAIGTTQDVTDSRAAEERERVRQREALRMLQVLDQVQALTKSGAWEYDPATNKVTWSKEMYRIHEVGEEFDLSHAENVFQFYDAPDRARMAAAQKRMLWEAVPYDLELSLTGARGTKKVIRTLAVPQSEGGRIVRILGYVADITEHKQAEEARRVAEAKDLEVKRLEDLNKMRMEFLNTAAHDLKTPLTPLRLAMGTLRLGTLTPAQKVSIDLMDRNIARFQALVEDMLDAARLQAGRLKLRREDVSPNPLVADAVASFQEPARQAGLTLRVASLPEARIDADPLKVMQVLMNLVSNAVKYTPRGGQVLVEARATPQEWEFLVHDSGLGMTAEQMSRLFQPFVRLHEDVPGTAKGTGLGLYISKGIVEQHGGRLWAESEGPGKGSTFHVAFPLAAAATAAPKAKGDPKAA